MGQTTTEARAEVAQGIVDSTAAWDWLIEYMEGRGEDEKIVAILRALRGSHIATLKLVDAGLIHLGQVEDIFSRGAEIRDLAEARLARDQRTDS